MTDNTPSWTEAGDPVHKGEHTAFFYGRISPTHTRTTKTANTPQAPWYPPLPPLPTPH